MVAKKTSPKEEMPQVDAVVTVDSRGQIVLPKDLRDKAAIKEGDKFAVISCRSGDNVCCIFLLKAEYFGKSIKGMLGPIMKDIVQ